MNQIPRRMSFFWSGRMSWLRWITLETFVKYNPDWEVYLYTSKIPPLPGHWLPNADDDWAYQGEDYLQRIPSQVHCKVIEPPIPLASAQLSDWFQWYILGNQGGFTADMDIIWVDSLTPTWEAVKRSSAVFCLQKGLMAIGLVGSMPGCQLFRDMVKCLPGPEDSSYQHYGVNHFYRFASVALPVGSGSNQGLIAITKLVGYYRKRGNYHFKVIVLPDYTVYPSGWGEIDRLWKASEPINQYSVGVHWFGSSSISRERALAITEDNWHKDQNKGD